MAGWASQTWTELGTAQPQIVSMLYHFPMEKFSLISHYDKRWVIYWLIFLIFVKIKQFPQDVTKYAFMFRLVHSEQYHNDFLIGSHLFLTPIILPSPPQQSHAFQRKELFNNIMERNIRNFVFFRRSNCTIYLIFRSQAGPLCKFILIFNTFKRMGRTGEPTFRWEEGCMSKYWIPESEKKRWPP